MNSTSLRQSLPILLICLAASSAVALTIDTVTVGNPGNPDDLGPGGAPIAGSVDYEYHIGKFEVTNTQYVEFLNAVDAAGANPRGLYNPQMTSDPLGGVNFFSAAANGSKYSVKSGRGNNPVVFVSFFDAIRFANWLHNGQGNGNTEDGAYRLDGGTAIPANADFVARSVTATWGLPTSDEWYKAAYHKNDGPTGHYFDYPTSTDATPFSAPPPGTAAPTPSNAANFRLNDGIANAYNNGYAVTGSEVLVPNTNYLSNIGAYSAAHSPYGTFDQAGNVWEWIEDLQPLESRRVAGGSWINNPDFLASSASNSTLASNETYTIGFRLVRVTPTAVSGDYNLNGQIDAADYTIWRDTLGSTSDLRANGDDSGASQGIIDQADYLFWKNAFPSTGDAAASPVPELTSASLTLLAICGLTACRRPILLLGHAP